MLTFLQAAQNLLLSYTQMMRLDVLLLVIYAFISGNTESVQVKTTSDHQVHIFSKYQKMIQNANATINEVGNTTRITFLNPTGTKAPIMIKLHALENTWVSTPTSMKVYASIITTSLWIGNLFSILVFRLAIRSGISKPLNLFIFVDQAFKMFGNTWSISVMALSAILNSTNLKHSSVDQNPLVTYMGETFCYVSRFVAEVFGGVPGLTNIILGKELTSKKLRRGLADFIKI